MISSTWVDSAPLSLNASLSSEARTWSLDWNGKAIARGDQPGRDDDPLLHRRRSLTECAEHELPGSGGQKWVERAVLQAAEPHAGAVGEVVGERAAGGLVSERERAYRGWADGASGHQWRVSASATTRPDLQRAEGGELGRGPCGGTSRARAARSPPR